MTDTIKNLKKSFDEYEDMQARHIRSFTSEGKPNIGQHHFERDQRFNNLRNDLTKVMHQINNNTTDDDRLNVAEGVRDRIQSVLDQDKILINRLSQYRKELIRHMGRMGHGKRALKGYQAHCGYGHTHRFMDKSG